MPAATAQYTIAPFAGAPDQVVTVAATALALTPNGNDVEPLAGDPLGIHVFGSERVNLQFTLVDTAGATYYVVGLALQQVAAGSGSPGRDNFPTFVVHGQSLTVTDDNRSQSTWEFWLLFQNADGRIGILDPKIQNT